MSTSFVLKGAPAQRSKVSRVCERQIPVIVVLMMPPRLKGKVDKLLSLWHLYFREQPYI